MDLIVKDEDINILNDLDSNPVLLSRRDLMNKQNLAYIVSQGINVLDIELSSSYSEEFTIELFKISKEIKGNYSGSKSDLAKLFKQAFPNKSAFITKLLIQGKDLMKVGEWCN